MIELTINSLRQVTPNITEQIYVGDTLEDITVRLPSSIAGKNIEEFEIKMRAYVDDETYFEYPIPTDKSSIDIDVGLALTDEVRNLKVLFVCTHASGEVGKTNFVVLKVEQSPDGTALSHTIEITENGEYDVTKYTEANVEVAGGIEIETNFNIINNQIDSANITVVGGAINVEIPSGVTSIGEYSFFRQGAPVNISIPNSVTLIGNYAFCQCGTLTSITIPDNVTYIGEGAFQSCVNLANITLSDSIRSIELYTFDSCNNLTSITLPDGITTIGSNAFSNCNKLTSITLPRSITTIGLIAFLNCSALTDVYFAGTQSEWEAITIDEGNDALTNATIHYNYTP